MDRFESLIHRSSHAALALTTLSLLASCAASPSVERASVAPINTVVGDRSFEEAFGYAPDADTDSVVRIVTHLHAIEVRLREADVSGLSPDQRARRAELLDELHEYHQKADGFPTSDGHSDARRPNFVDAEGRVCAVGALLPEPLLVAMNTSHKHDYLRDIDSPALRAWASASGFTLDELASIQPGYEASPQNAYCSCPDGFPHGVEPVEVERYRAAVEEAVMKAQPELAACVRGHKGPGMFEVVFDVSFSGQAYNVSVGQKHIDRGCMTRKLQRVRLPASCGQPLRSMRFQVNRDAGGAVSLAGVSHVVDPSVMPPAPFCGRSWEEG